MKENIEEEKAINNMKMFARVHQDMTIVTAEDMDIVLNLIEKLQKENEELKEKWDKDTHKLQNDLDIANAKRIDWEKAYQEEKDKQIDLMAEEIEKGIGNVCPLNDYNYDLNCENECKDDYKKCWKQYFENKVRQESDKGATGK